MDNYFKGCPPKMADGRFLQDFRSPSRRELYTKTINGITRDDDQRLFYQQNAEKIMNQEWNMMKQQFSCFPNCCIHNYPTRTDPGSNYEELRLYNAVRTNKIQKGDNLYPACNQMPDYRMTDTKQN